jgi:transcriptional regulator with XRE-family HTH domain
MLRFAEFHSRLVVYLRDRVRSGDLTERGLARMTGISQPHIHNVLKGKKFFSLDVCDTILSELNLDLLDLLHPAELKRQIGRLNLNLSGRCQR